MDDAIERDLQRTSNLQSNHSIQEPHVEVIDDRTGCDKCYYMCCHPNGFFHRGIALMFMCFLGIGSYFCYDNPGSLQARFTDDLGLSNTEFQMLYSFYSWPNVFLCFVGGFLIDRVFGIRLGTTLYVGITLLGQLIFALGCYISSFPLMIVGRFIFGIGAESGAVGQNNYAVLWFKGRALNMVFGFQMSFVRVGSAVGFEVMAPIYDFVDSYIKDETYRTTSHVLGWALLLAGTTCLLSLVCAILLGVMDKRSERITNRVEMANTEVVKLSDVVYFKAEFWMICVVCVTFYSCIFPFISQGQRFYITQFNMTDNEANNINSLVYWIAAVVSPIAGFLIDRTGRNVAWILCAIIAATAGHFLLGFVTSLTPYVGVVLLGLGYSTLASSLWPLVAIIIPEYQLGTAYGVCQAIQNLGLAVAAIIAGEIVDKWGYQTCEYFFLGNLILALISSIILSFLDRRRKGNLDMSPQERKAYQAQKDAIITPLIPTAQPPAVDIPSSGLLSSYDENDIGSALESQLRNKYLKRPTGGARSESDQ